MDSTHSGNPAEWLQGFLRAFGWFNTKGDLGYTFTLDVFPKPVSIEEAIADHFKGQLLGLSLTAVEEWSVFLRQFLSRWLFEFSNPRFEHLEDPKKSFALSHEYSRDKLLDEVTGRFSSMVKPLAVWKVEARTHGHYECHWEDVAFEEAERVIYLHLGVSD